MSLEGQNAKPARLRASLEGQPGCFSSPRQADPPSREA